MTYRSSPSSPVVAEPSGRSEPSAWRSSASAGRAGQRVAVRTRQAAGQPKGSFRAPSTHARIEPPNAREHDTAAAVTAEDPARDGRPSEEARPRVASRCAPEAEARPRCRRRARRSTLRCRRCPSHVRGTDTCHDGSAHRRRMRSGDSLRVGLPGRATWASRPRAFRSDHLRLQSDDRPCSPPRAADRPRPCPRSSEKGVRGRSEPERPRQRSPLAGCRRRPRATNGGGNPPALVREARPRA